MLQGDGLDNKLSVGERTHTELELDNAVSDRTVILSKYAVVVYTSSFLKAFSARVQACHAVRSDAETLEHPLSSE